MRTRQYIAQAITVALLLLWIPVSIDKIINFQQFKYGILQQPLSYRVAWAAIYSLPLLEFLTAGLLVYPKYRWIGLRLSSLLMAAFTGYVGLALLGALGKVPCACGSVISGMSWIQHFWFNLLFLVISITGFILHKKPRYCHPECNEGSHDITASLENTNIKPSGLQRE